MDVEQTNVRANENEKMMGMIGRDKCDKSASLRKEREGRHQDNVGWRLLHPHHGALTVDSFQPRLDPLHVCFTGGRQVSRITGARNIWSSTILSESLQR